MLDTAIVGGGVCGLALARDLQRQGRAFALFEARSRLGGRVWSVVSESTGQALDLGPTWYWPDIHPRMANAVAELGLAVFPQHDNGTVLALREADGKVESLGDQPVHNGAVRVAGGMARLVEALAASLPAGSIRLEHPLVAVVDHGSHVALHFRVLDRLTVIEARRVVLAIPPRVVEEQVSFTPNLGHSVREALRGAPTWMAGEAKALTAFTRAFWRAAGLSGNGFSRHEQAALGELFDACEADGQPAALGGFVALNADLRASFREGMAMLVSSQLAQFFGTEAESGEFHYQDWATEPYTCSQLDRQGPDEHPDYADPRLMQPHWGGRLWFGSSETARYGGGYLEGALEAAARLAHHLSEPLIASVNRSSIERFGVWAQSRREQAIERYRDTLNRRLAAQERDQLTQRSLLFVVEGIYAEALLELDQLGFVTDDVGVANGRSDLTPPLLAPFNGFNEALIDAAVEFNHGSCALSNFPEEHDPSPDYLQTIRRDLGAAWREFAWSVNAKLLPVPERSVSLTAVDSA